MPEDENTDPMPTPDSKETATTAESFAIAKLSFVSQFLGLVPIPAKTLAGRVFKGLTGPNAAKIRERRENNAEIFKSYKDFLDANAALETRLHEVDVLHGRLIAEDLDRAAKVRRIKDLKENAFKDVMAAQSLPKFEDTAKFLRSLHNDLDQLVREANAARDAQAKKTAHAQAEAPGQLINHKIRSLAEQIAAARAQLADFKELRDQPSLDPAIVRMPFFEDDTKSLSNQRDRALEQLKSAHKDAAKSFYYLLPQLEYLQKAAAALFNEPSEEKEKANLLHQVEKVRGILASDVKKLAEARTEPINQLIGLAGDLHAAAQVRMTKRGTSDPVAKREDKRATIINVEIANLSKALKNLSNGIHASRAELARTESFGRRKKLQSTITADQAQLDRLEARKAQLEGYQSGAAARLVQILGAEKDRKEHAAALLKLEQDKPLVPANFDAATNGYTKILFTTLKGLRIEVEAAHKRVRHDLRVFIDEPEITEITADDRRTLIAMIDMAEAFLVPQTLKLNQAASLEKQARALLTRLKAASNFELPPVPAPKPSLLEEIDKKIEKIGVMLDELWGKGCDDASLRKEFVARKNDRRELASAMPLPAARLDTKLSKLEKDIAVALLKPPIKAVDNDELDKAREKQKAIAKSLLKLHKTVQIPTRDVGNHPRDHIIAITNDAGEREFHVIDTKKNKKGDGGKEDHRADGFKHLSREVMTGLRERMQAIEVMIEHAVPGQEEMILELSSSYEKNVEYIATSGAEYYKILEKRIKEIDAISDHKALKGWTLTGLAGTRKSWDNLKSDARKTLDRETLFPRFAEKLAHYENTFKDHLKRAQGLPKKQEDANADLDKIEKEMAFSKSAGEASFGAQMKALIKEQAALAKRAGDRSPSPTIQEKQKKIQDLCNKLGAVRKDLRGVQGELRYELDRLKRQAEVRSEEALQGVQAGIDELRKRLMQRQAALSTLLEKAGTPQGASNGDGKEGEAKEAARMEKLAQFLQRELKNIDETKTASADMEKAAAKAKEARKRAETSLKQGDTDHPQIATLSTVLDGLSGRLDQIDADFKRDANPVTALKRYDEMSAAFDGFCTNVTGLVSGKVDKTAFEFEKIEKKVASVAEKLVKSVKDVSDTMMAEFNASENYRDAPGAQDAVEAVRKTLKLVTRPDLRFDFENDRKSQLKKIKNLENAPNVNLPDLREAKAKLREDALADLRSYRELLEAHPALSVYRNHPFKCDNLWPLFRAVLLEVQNGIRTGLAP